jgi:hypothetical protein
MTKEIVASELLALLENGKFVEALDKIALAAGTPEVQQRNNLAARKKKLAKAVKDSDAAVLERMVDIMASYVDDVARIFPDEPRQLTRAEAHVLMQEAVQNKEVAEFVGMRKDAIRELAFMSIDEANRAKGLDPTLHGGKLPVPSLGKVFCKEGVSAGTPSIDHGKLRELLGDDADKVFREVVIPEQRETVLDEAALSELAVRRPEVLMMLREALRPGTPSAGRFMIRDLQDED